MDENRNEEMDQFVLQRILKLVHKHTGITMAENKRTLLQGRLRRRIKDLSLSSYIQYLDHLEATKGEAQEFINLVTTNETSFFRTNRIWEYLQKEYFPVWFMANPGKTLKIWSAASSTGEEAHTIGICCQEFKSKNPSFNYLINGTDIDTGVLAVAEKGEYQGRSIDGFKTINKVLFEKYMQKTDDGYKVIDDVRRNIKFSTHNLFNTPTQKGYYDLIFLRNVLIYFEAKDQEAVIENINQGLGEKGLLVIGESESLARLKTNFQFKAPLIYGRTGS